MNDYKLKEDFLVTKDINNDDKSIQFKVSGIKKYLTSDNIGMLLACSATFFNAFGSFYTKVIQRTFPDKFHTVPFLFMRSFTILILAFTRAWMNNEAILRPNQIKNKWFFFRTNINFFGVSSITMSLWYLRASTAQIINSLNPIIVFVLSYFILNEAFYFRYLIGIVMCICGSLIIVLNEKDAKDDIHDMNPKEKKGFETLLGVGFALFSACAVALVSFSNKILVDCKVSINSQMFYVGLSTMMYSSIFVLFFGGVELDLGYLVMCSIHGIFFFLANISYNMALMYSSLNKLALINYLQIVFVFILAFIFLHESIFLTDLLGATIIMSYLCYNVYYPPQDKAA